MKHPVIIAAGALALGAASIPSLSVLSPLEAQPAAARTEATRTATFVIQNITCALCPVTVSSTMESVRGVRSVGVDFDAKTSHVVFAPSTNTLTANTAAPTKSGHNAQT